MKPAVQQDSATDGNARYRDAGRAIISDGPQLTGLEPQDGSQSATGDQETETKPKSSLLQSNIPAAPTISLPTGGGAIRGIGEKFSVNPNTGTGSLTLPVKTSPGRSGLQPTLSLSYDSGSGNGEFGLGWRLSGIEAITRKTTKGLPRYNDHGSDQEADVFILAGAEDLVPLWNKDTRGNVILDRNGRPTHDERNEDGFIVRAYAPRILTIFNRIERWVSTTDRGNIHWRVISPDNVTTIYGSSDASRIFDPVAASEGRNPHIFSWLQSETYDPFGNAMVFSYKREDSANINSLSAHEANRSALSRQSNLYLKSIRYGNIAPNRDATTWDAFSALSLPQDTKTWKYSVVLDYGEHSPTDPEPGDGASWLCRQDPFSRYNSGFEIRTYRLCRRILMFHHFEELGTEDYLVSSLDLRYDESPTLTYLVSAEQAGYSGGQASGQTPLRRSLPPVDLSYSRFPSDHDLANLEIENLDTESIANLPIGLDERTYRWVDLDGEGISGILSSYQNSWYYKRNTSTSNFSETGDNKLVARLGPLEAVASGPFLTASSLDMQFGDVNGNGKLDIISRTTGQWGYFERDPDEEALGWTEFRPFHSSPLAIPGPDAQFIDLTGDGFADLLIHNDQVYTWYQSQGSGGFSAPESITQDWDETKGPVCVFADSRQTVLLANMSGNTLQDICRIRNGDCCYWPNLGYGRFGAQVNLDNGPWSDYYGQFDHTRVRVADIDGSGTSDILYLTNNGVDVYLNQSGNSFSGPKHVPLPGLDGSSVFNVVDLLGNGTQCFVWSSSLPSNSYSPLRYVDVFASRKPHLLHRITNNLGSETVIQYAPSTQFYLQDKENGRPWITSLHFPVQCVEVVETVDAVSGNRFASSYRYSHGFYDGVEREFRGFARVEQIDASTFLPVTSPSAWHVPPVHTVTWFDTGAYFHRSTMASILAREYFGNSDAASAVLDSTQIPVQCVEGVQQVEACRALKGKVLRVEVYSDDSSTKAHIPYTVQTSSFTIDPTQVVHDAHQHGICFVHSRESTSCSYERSLGDPRVTHQMVLETDSFGNVLKELNIAYGRVGGQSPLNPEDAAKQEKTAVIYQEWEFTNSLGGQQYRIPAPCAVRQYELRGLEPDSTTRLFQYDHLTADAFSAILSLPEIPFENEGQSPDASYRRLLRNERSFYKADNMAGLLPAGILEPLGLPGSYHKLVFTPGLFGMLFTQTMADGSRSSLLSIPEALEGTGYVDLDGNGHLWTASVKISYTESFSSTTTPAEELTAARGGFFTPKTFIDIFGNPYTATYDNYHLLPVKSRDALGNAVTTTVDYRVLQPSSVLDPNNNKSSVVYDALGLVAAVAISGKPSDNIGDTLDNLEVDLPEDRLDSFLSDPSPSAIAMLLGNATTRIVSDLWRWKRSQTPIYSVALSRDTHVNFPPPPGGLLFQVQITYSGGFGRVIQKKIRIKSGPISEGGPVVNDRWVGTGWAIFNSKGKPVKLFEPFFDTSAAYQHEMMVGVSSTHVYDPLNRPVAVIHPDRTIHKTVFGPWYRYEFDANDNILLSDPRQDPDVGRFLVSIPEGDMLPSWYNARKSGSMGREQQDAAAKSLAHANTPKTTHFDSLGRPFIVETQTGSETVKVTMDLDIVGNPRVVRDGLSRKSGASEFDMCQRQVRLATIDSGYTVDFLDGVDQKSMTWNSRDFRFRFEYDRLRRPTNSWWRGQDGGVEVLTSQVQYGEEYQSLSGDTAESHNLRTRVWKVSDQSGVVTRSDYSWDGSLTRSTKRFAAEYKQVFDVATGLRLEDEEHMSSDTFDAQHRPIRSIAPDGTITSRVYSQSGQLDKALVNTKGEMPPDSDPSTWTLIVDQIQHNAKGQLTSVAYGNGTTTTRTYDELTFRLRQLRTVRSDTGTVVQDLRYTYDAVGNITNLRDASQQTVFFRNTVVDSTADYTYDALYRLIEASGREHLGQTNGRPDVPTAPSGLDNTHDAGSALDPGNGNAMGRYKESYSYDLAGNLLSMRHESSDSQIPGWTRTYSYNEPSLLEPGRFSNRLSETSVGSLTEVYRYEGSAGRTGNMSSMAHLPLMAWDFAEQLQATSKQVVNQGGAQVPETTYYVYNRDGQRVRKVTESQAGPNSQATPTRLQERIYLGDYEIFRKYSPNAEPAEGPPPPTLERTVFHASTDYGHLADICSRTVGSDDGTPRQIRFQLHNHLGSGTVELSATGELLSYEEYFPFGASSYKMTAGQTGTARRFRFSGKELDSENGLYYFGARYYAAWIGRWTAADPVIRPGSRYDFAADNPVHLVDPDGRDPKVAQEAAKPAEAKPPEPEKVKMPTFPPDKTDPMFRLPVPAEAGRFPSQTTWTPGQKIEPTPKLLGAELKITKGDENVEGTITISAETPFKISDWPALPEFKTGTLKLSEDFKLKLAPFAVGTFGVSATQDLSTTAGKGENKLKLEISGGLQFMMPGNWELDVSGKASRTVSDKAPGPGVNPTTIDWSAGMTAILPKHLSANPIALGLMFSGSPVSPFAPVPGAAPPPPGGFSAVLSLTVGFSWPGEAGKTPIRKADILQTNVGKNAVELIEKEIPISKSGFDVGVEKVVTGVTGTEMPKIFGVK